MNENDVQMDSMEVSARSGSVQVDSLTEKSYQSRMPPREALSRCRFALFGLAWLSLGGCSASIQRDAPEIPQESAKVATPGPVRAPAEVIEVKVTGSEPVLPQGVTSFGAAELDGTLYLLGGFHGETHSYSRGDQSGDLLAVDLKTHTWRKIGKTDPAQSVALVAYEGSLIRTGGMEARNASGEPADLHSLATVERFTPSDGAQTLLPPLPQPRSSHDAVVLDHHLYVVGGWRMAGAEAPQWQKTMARLDLRNPGAGWQELPVPFERRALAIAAVSGRIVALGGMDSADTLSSRVDVFDPASGQWQRGPDLPNAGFGVAATAVGDTIYASASRGVVHAWTLGATIWTPVASLTFPRYFHRLVADRSGDLLVVGGVRSEGSQRVRVVERVALGAPGVATAALTLPSPLDTKNRQGLALHGDTLYIFGGNRSLGQHDFGPEFFSDQGFVLDLASLEWRSIAPYPVPRQTMSTWVAPWGHVMSLGGFGHDGTTARSHPEVFAFNPRSNAWQQVGALPGKGRTQFGLTVHEEAFWLFGGLDFDPSRGKADQFHHETSVLTTPLKPELTPFTTAGTRMSKGRRAFAGALVGDRYYAVGGMREGFSLADDCEVYDLKTERWEPMPCPSRPRLSGEMVALHGKLYLVAGSSPAAQGGGLEGNRSLEVFDIASSTWSTLATELPIEPAHLRMLPYGDRLLLFSTHNEAQKAELLFVTPPFVARES